MQWIQPSIRTFFYNVFAEGHWVQLTTNTFIAINSVMFQNNQFIPGPWVLGDFGRCYTIAVCYDNVAGIVDNWCVIKTKRQCAFNSMFKLFIIYWNCSRIGINSLLDIRAMSRIHGYPLVVSLSNSIAYTFGQR